MILLIREVNIDEDVTELILDTDKAKECNREYYKYLGEIVGNPVVDCTPFEISYGSGTWNEKQQECLVNLPANIDQIVTLYIEENC